MSITLQYFAAVLLVIGLSSALGIYQAFRGGIPAIHGRIPIDLLIGLPLVGIGLLTGKAFPVVVGAGLLALFFHGSIAAHIDRVRDASFEILINHIEGDPRDWWSNEEIADAHEFDDEDDRVEFGLLLDLTMSLREAEFVSMGILEKAYDIEGDPIYRVASRDRWIAWFEHGDDFEKDFEDEADEPRDGKPGDGEPHGD